jgi:predicted nucleic acid-binding Zn ribbon protein
MSTTENTQQELPLRKRVKKTLLHVTQIAFTLLSLLWLLFLVIGIGLWLGNTHDLNNLIGGGFFFLLLLGCSYVVYATDKALEEFRPRTKMNREAIKKSMYSFLPTIVIFVSMYLLISYFGLFPTAISATLSLEVLKTLIQTDGFLIGFSGIVFAQMLWAIHNQQANIQKSILEEPFAPNERVTSDPREYYLEAFERKRKSMIILMFLVIALFLISILLSVNGMAQTEANTTMPTNPTLTNPFLFMAYGILLFAGSLTQSEMDIRGDVIRILKRRVRELEKEKIELERRKRNSQE